jgi:hypothetical protein
MKFKTIEDFDKIDLDKITFDDHFMKNFKSIMDVAFDDLKFLDEQISKDYPNLSPTERFHIIALSYNRGLRRGFIVHSNPPNRKKFLGIF